MERRAERIKLLKLTASWAAALLVYYLFIRLTGLSIPCAFRTVTGLKCPGCGVTHMAVHAAHFEFGKAFADNPLLFIMIPFLLSLLAVKIVFMPPQLNSNSRLLNGITYVCIGLLMIFCVVRNIVGI